MKSHVGGCSVVNRWLKGCMQRVGDGSATWLLPHWQFPPSMLLPLASSLQRDLSPSFLPNLDNHGASWWVVASVHRVVVGS
ncbi:hypothetical protein V6N11_021535 [Hibiscus sabdariffa]|uniref:Uncharacterized protein n=2 Tax=Hibiscus sabdariffa TaxID=183260 RepID=A0ABR2NHL1_9ROSI